MEKDFVRMSSLRLFISLFMQILSVKSQDLICNGNFTGYVMSGRRYDGELCQLVPSNYSCWFDKNGGQIQIKEKLYPPMGYSVELVATVAYTLCQKVQL